MDALATESGLSARFAQSGALPFQDGMTNLMKYAFHMNLSSSDTHGSPAE